jgi:hypothetical protein
MREVLRVRRHASESLQGRKPRLGERKAMPQALWGFERRGQGV